MTAISDATPFQPSPPAARPVQRAQRQDFSDHIAAHAESERGQEGVHDLSAPNRPGTSPVAEMPSPEVQVPVPIHLQASTASSTRVFEWGLRVNGYLSEVVASDPTANANSPGQTTVALNAAGPVAKEWGEGVPFGAIVSARTGAAQSVGGLNRVDVPTDADVNLTDELANPALTAAGDEPFQRTLVRWVGTTTASTLYIRNFRLSPDEAKELAFTLTAALGRTWPPFTRMVINGRLTQSHPLMPPQGASPCLSIP